MIKKILLFVVCIWGFTLHAQIPQSKNQIFIGAGAQQELQHSTNLNVNLQVGGAILFQTGTAANNKNTVAFPYSILYVPNTFVNDRYNVSKGYYTDRVRLNWEIGANENIITNIQIFRKELGTSNPEQLIATLAKDVFEYDDFQTQGGQLYEYRVKAQGVSNTKEEEFFNFIQGIGFRNPTATVSGNISYEGGNPVKDVTVYAEAVGAENNAGNSIYLNGGYVTTDKLQQSIDADEITLQGWSTFVRQDNAGNLFDYFTSNGETYSIVSKITSSNIFVIDVYKNSNYIFNIHVRGSLPTGEIDALGNDIYRNIRDFTQNDFYHLSLVMQKGEKPKVYINARAMTPDNLNNVETSGNFIKPQVSLYRTVDYTTAATEKIDQIDIAFALFDVHIDEVRVWDRALGVDEIRKDYRRYLNGSENGLKLYLRADEKAGDFLYDISKVGNIQNENHARLIKNNNTGANFSNTIPRTDQLGVFGVTDKNGSYTIAAIPYAGNGESFEITPSLGVHQFNPATQTLFLGKDEPVVNKVDFIDISSFKFNGKAVYNVQNVFNPIASTNPSNLRDSENYNQYLLDGVPINKGEYYYEGGAVNPSTGFYEGGTLHQYPVVPVAGANVLIDGNLVFDEDNQPVLTAADGTFTVDVPIGNHRVEVEKEGHVFALNGRFPETGTFTFFEDQIETRWFIDTTRVSLVGKVVGGKKEFEKPIGFGFNGKRTYTNFEDTENELVETVSANNNIGVAQITFKGDINSNDFDKIVVTNTETGEFKVDLIPYQYQIVQNGITIPTNTDIAILSSTETLDLREIPTLKTSKFTARDNTEIESEAYHYVKNFRYNSEVSVYLLEQEFDTAFTIGENTFDISNLNTPIYTQKELYKITFEAVQEYINKDGAEPVITKEFFTEGAFNITNNLAQNGTETLELKENNTKYEYAFRAGLPNITIADNFANNINVQYVIDGQSPISIKNSNAFKASGIIKGGRPSAGKTFVTNAPETPEIILRDPPGSNSFATIEKGTTFSVRTVNKDKLTDSSNDGYFISMGPNITVSKGAIFAYVDTELDAVNEASGSITKTTENTSENETTVTYTFNQTISTSDNTSFVGSDGDLFIGNSKNIYYGVFDNMFITENIPLDKDNNTIPNIPITAKDKDGNDVTLYVSTKKDYFIAEQPTDTFFTYSQKYVLETLIPELESLAALGATVQQGTNGVNNSSEFYTAQANLWRKVIQKNEKAKYDAKNNRQTVKDDILDRVTTGFVGDFRGVLRNLVNENFYSNRSFDAGLGEFTNSVTSAVFTSNTNEITIDITEEAKNELGFFVNDVGFTVSFENTTTSVETDSFTEEQEITNSISYTLKDNDKSNLLSVDVVNMFDGNGPVFITRGGTTSCPYEGEVTSIFFNNDSYDPDTIGTGGEVLSEATNKVYNAEISVEKALITNVPESDAAVFMLYLKNTSETQTDLEFILDFDSTSLNGAEINLETNGTNVFLPFNETIEFPIEISKSGSSSRYKYENIKLLLYSPCAFASERDDISINITAEFKKSCSKVAIDAPQNNWVFNNNEAYSVDVNGNVTTNMLPITFTDFNPNFTGFNKIELQYRNASASNWTKFASYYGSEALKNTAGDTEGIVIASSDSEFTYNWDIVGQNIPDGDYEFRAVSYCTDNITNESEVISGTINLNAPVVFGTPKPTDGILDVGEDIAVRFNEDIFKRGTTNITVTGLKNQQEIDHSVSVYLDGTTNQIELPNQRLNNQSFTLQFWYKNATTGVGKLVSQENGINVTIDGNHLDFSLGNQTVSTKTTNRPLDASQYNFYSFVYQNGTSPQLLILENGKVLENLILTEQIDINTSESIFIGGQNVEGNLHDVRLWAKPFTPAQATVAKDVTLTGRELNLLGYWKLDEGFGTTALDKAKRKNATVNLGWDIFPKGTGYEFKNSEYLTLNSVGFIQPTNFEDMTLSFWIKPNETSAGTIFSNGKGDNSETILTNGFRNKWAVNMTSSGHLELAAEDEIFPITNNALPANTWSHVAITLRRGGSLNAYINGNEEVSVTSAKIGGFTGNKILIGARLFTDISTNETIDNHFTGKLDELRFWNTARSIDQIKRDRYFEIDKETEGLLLYVDFNEDTTNTSNGPAYHHADINLTTGTTFALLNGASQNYVQDSPPIKPPLKYTNIPFSTVINGDEMIIQPELTTEEWSLFEGEIINFSVARLSDTHFNTQQSPVTWSTLVNRQELEWYTEKQTKEIVTQKTMGQEFSFTMDVVNIGNSNQPFTISGIPTWLQAEITSGTINPNATRQITFTVDKDLAMGNYTSEIFLETASGFNDRLSFSLRVLADAPDWSVNPRDFLNSMNAIGKIELDGVFSRDQYTKVGAFINDEKRGEAYLVYDTFYDSYFAYLTIYSNNTDTNITEEVTFKIWDAVNGKIIAAAIDGTAKINFLQNEVLGSSANPKIFSATNLAEQNLALNVGWSWVSFFADDSRFNDLEATLNSLELSNGDAVKSQSQFVNREDGIWQGDLKTFDIAKMYKIKLAKNNNLRLKGTEIDPANFTLNIAGKADPSDTPKWNWLPFPIHRNIALQEALAFYNAADGDVIKDQFSFAIYDVNSGWRGTLNYLESGQGYMLKSSNQQTFKYPNTEVLQKTATNKVIAKNNTDNNTNFAQYSSNMSIVAEVISDYNYTKVMVYDANDVLRGVADITNINGKKYSFITAFSNKTETLKFFLANAVATLDINKNFTFKDNEVLGDFSNPIQLSSKALTTDSFVLNDAVLYPNPFTNQITVDLSNENIKISKVDIFNTIGVTVLSKKVTNTNKTVLETSNLSNGIYLIRLTNNKGAFVIKKMIKK